MCSFTIAGLPEQELATSSQNSYLILAEKLDLVFKLSYTLLKNIVAKKQALFCVSADIEILRTTSFANNQTYFKTLERNKKLHLFGPTDLCGDVLKTKQIRAILNELKIYKNFAGSVLILSLDANQLYHLKEQELVNLANYLKSQAERWQLTLYVNLYGPATPKLSPSLHKLGEYFSGFLTVQEQSQVTQLFIDYWISSAGVSYQKNILLDEDSGQWQVREIPPSTDVSKEEYNSAYDEKEVWVVAAAINALAQMPAVYRQIESNQALFKKAQQLTAATVVFVVTRHTDLVYLARQCYRLRIERGAWLKIVVQNLDGIVRHRDESLLLNSGVNLILYQLSHPSRFISSIESMQGLKFTRKMPPDFDFLVKNIEVSRAYGYRTMDAFCKQVISVSQAADNLSVSSVLVRLTLLPSSQPIHALRILQVKREGDLYTNFKNDIILYLSACRISDVDRALEHMFFLDVDEFFVRKSVISEHFYIQQFCRAQLKDPLLQQAQDYSTQLNQQLIIDEQADYENEDASQVADKIRALRVADAAYPVELPIKRVL
ncbi:cellulose biosynthesis protein BcsE [Gayadomonas joobiniege]|uniref:cellulose biosynthesis protein BcsE n=1 Tax=Gayadomonas joobiniege TaxID=1234606 RepID=UPI0003710553|nr:cellulose biosynthesis protein BcsE [Gayadomonas joobiniege]